MTDVFKIFSGEMAQQVASAFTGRPEDIVKVDAPFLDEKAEVFIIQGQTFFVDWYSEVAVKINDRNMTDLIKALCLSAKEYGVRYNQGEYVEKLMRYKQNIGKG